MVNEVWKKDHFFSFVNNLSTIQEENHLLRRDAHGRDLPNVLLTEKLLKCKLVPAEILPKTYKPDNHD